jgi:periplasmic protein CpxP/Spy
MKPEVAKILDTELKRFSTDLNLSDTQKAQLRTALENAQAKLEEIRAKHPDMTRTDVIAKLREVRGLVRERVVKFFTPEQLKKWDAEVAKAKTFLGHDVA